MMRKLVCQSHDYRHIATSVCITIFMLKKVGMQLTFGSDTNSDYYFYNIIDY